MYNNLRHVAICGFTFFQIQTRQKINFWIPRLTDLDPDTGPTKRKSSIYVNFDTDQSIVTLTMMSTQRKSIIS